jgi:catechol 2,3-dioxygenase-like lactoylglutathione lyase family enzyme
VTSAPTVRAAHLVLDVTDLERAARFWSALLGLGVSRRESDCLDLGPLGVGGPVLSFQLVPEPKAVKNRLHLDLGADPAAGGVVAAAARAQALGARPASALFDAGTSPWQVWRDPDGNEFCLVTDAPSVPPPDGADASMGSVA